MAVRRKKRILGIPDEFWIGFVIMVGVFLKLVYDIETGYNLSGINVGEWKAVRGAAPGSGSLGVIQYYYNHHWLPNFDPRTYSGYAAPPLYYIVSALLMELFHRLVGWEADFCIRLLQCANVIYVTIGTSCGISLLSKLGVRGRKMTVSILFLSFFPEFYIMTAIIGPDALVFMLIMLSLNSAVEWYLTRRYRDMRSLAVTMGLAILTSYRAWFIVPAVGVLFFYGWRDGRTHHVPLKTQLKRFGYVFSVLALIWPVYLLIRFRLPLFYADPISSEWQSFRGLYSAGKRLSLTAWSLLRHFHTTGITGQEYNIWVQTFKTACFDFSFIDTSLGVVKFLAGLMLFITILLCITWHVMGVKVLTGRKISTPFKVFLVSGYGTILLFYVICCFVRPYAETSNFRMIPELILFPLACMGLCGKETEEDSLFYRITSMISSYGILALSVLSALLFGLFS